MSLKKLLLLAGLCLASFASTRAQVNVSITVAPPPLPVYEQPLCPVEGYLWTPGYWAYTDGGYYWVPGVWVEPPRVGVLWTPGYWGFADNVYVFHTGYWGPTVGFYGGINYGFGYGGVGYVGGGWQGDHFRYNTAVTRVNVTNIHNTYIDKTVINKQVTRERTSFNGGPKGIKAEPTEEQRQAMSAEHINPTAAQEQHRQEASQNKAQFASANHGKPGTLAADQPAGSKPEDQRRAQVPDTHVGTPKQKPPTTHVGTPKQTPPPTHVGTPEQRPDTHIGTSEEHPNTHIGTPKQEARPHTKPPQNRPEGRPPQANRPAPKHEEPRGPKPEEHKKQQSGEREPR